MNEKEKQIKTDLIVDLFFREGFECSKEHFGSIINEVREILSL